MENSGPYQRQRTGQLGTVVISKAMIGFAAFLSLAMSVYLFFSGAREQGLFVGLWVPSILAAGAFIHAGGRHV